MEPYPVGTIVDYHGSLDYMHGLYEIERIGTPRPGREADYEDGAGYVLWPVGVPKKFGNREESLYFVRRQSITPVKN